MNHKNGIKTDNRPENLEWMTVAENHRHAFATGLRAGRRGEANPVAKLNASKVTEIRDRYARGGITQAALGAEYGINRGLVSMVVRRKRWGHV